MLRTVLQAHTGLSSLRVFGGSSQLPLASLLRRFQHLQSVFIAAPSAALVSLLPAMQQLQQLTMLHLQQDSEGASSQQETQRCTTWMVLLPGLLSRLFSLDAQLGYLAAFEAPGLRALQQATKLTSLSLTQTHGEPPAAAANELPTVLPQLPGLAALSLRLPDVTVEMLNSITLLTALTRLCLASNSACLPASIVQLTLLSRLQRLKIQEHAYQWLQPQQPILEWPAPRAFHSLQRVKFETYNSAVSHLLWCGSMQDLHFSLLTLHQPALLVLP